ncbi:MAG: hypothetical protein V1755_02685 [Chloroflexota bacterium]
MQAVHEHESGWQRHPHKCTAEAIVYWRLHHNGVQESPQYMARGVFLRRCPWCMVLLSWPTQGEQERAREAA